VFKFIHAADLHLDSPLKGLQRYEGAPVDALRGATRRALANLVELALAELVDFVLIAGDVYDGNWLDHNTGLYFVGQMARLREAGIPVTMIAGNHDAANKMTRSLRLPENVQLLDHRRPQSVELERTEGVVVHGQSFASAAVLDRLAAAYPAGRRGAFNIGLLHTSADGRYDGHDPYAPCSLDELRSREYDYWALGHVHQRAVLLEEPYVAFAGNLQGRHVRECGAKGCLVVSVDAHQRPTVRFEPLDVVRWAVCPVDVTGAQRIDDVLDRCAVSLGEEVRKAGDRLLAVRIELRGACPAHDALAARTDETTAQLRALAIDRAGGPVWVERVKVATHSDGDAAPPAEGPLGELVALLAELAADEDELACLARELEPLANKLPRDLCEEPGGPRLSDPGWLRDCLADVGPMLLGRLAKGGHA
jgi:DNA repair exonuclease SbcCD nuclease subunit